MKIKLILTGSTGMVGEGVLHECLQHDEVEHVLVITGAPQPEALRFYEKTGITQITAFGKWMNDDTAICFEKKLLQVL